MRRPSKPWLAAGVFLALLLAAVALRFLAGPDGLALPLDTIEWRLRGERVASGLIVGAALSIAGVFLQSLLRNPLAEPAVLGLTSGAGLGVVISIYLAYRATGAIVQYHAPVLPALLGAFAALAIVGLLGQRKGLIEPVTLILVGVVVSLISGAGILFVQHLMPDRGVAMASRWVMGTLSNDVAMPWIAGVGALTVVSLFVGMRLGAAMDAASMSDDEARSVGVRLGPLRATLFVLAGALAAGSVLLAGPIGFVGLVCPHLARLLGGPAHRPLVLSAALLGGTAIILADAGVRLIDLGAGRMPIGVLTALIGGPVFIALLRREMLR
ncbi:MAG: FecCD family ABC transporter permease [Phycisphaerales bacterium]